MDNSSRELIGRIRPAPRPVKYVVFSRDTVEADAKPGERTHLAARKPTNPVKDALCLALRRRFDG